MRGPIQMTEVRIISNPRFLTIIVWDIVSLKIQQKCYIKTLYKCDRNQKRKHFNTFKKIYF